MIENDHGHICSIASSAGYFAVPKLAEYCASKAAAAHFADVSFKLSRSDLFSDDENWLKSPLEILFFEIFRNSTCVIFMILFQRMAILKPGFRKHKSNF